MITLKDYIGKIYKEVTNAKVQSDIETLAIAQEYVQNPMLKHFSVPNIRIKNMELTIPVAVDKTESIVRDYTEREIKEAYMSAFETTYLSFLPYKRDYFENFKFDLSVKAEHIAADIAPQLQEARAQDIQLAQAQAQPTSDAQASRTTVEPVKVAQAASYVEPVGAKYTIASAKAATVFAETSYGYVGTDIPQREFEAAVIEKVKAALVPKSPQIEELPVIIETQRLKLINDPASMISIKVNITDDAMEWTTDVDADGNATQVLNYE